MARRDRPRADPLPTSILRVFSTSHDPPGSSEDTPAIFIPVTAEALDNPGLVRAGGRVAGGLQVGSSAW